MTSSGPVSDHRFISTVVPNESMLDLLQIKTFLTVANTRSFTRTAEVTGYAQSSVTAQIKALERDLGVRLFERCRFSKTVVLTREGETMVLMAHKMLQLADEMKAAVRSNSVSWHNLAESPSQNQPA